MKWVTKNEVNRVVYPQLNKISNDVYFRYIPKSIKDSMILWYDIQRQGATNENMAINPILKDLSGNGHDAKCYNFDWDGMSGIGGYVTNYNNYGKYSGVEVNDHVITSTTVEEGQLYNWIVFIDAKTNEVPSYKIRVTGTTAQTGLTYRYVDENNTVQYFSIPEDGEYTLPAIHRYSGDRDRQSCGFQINQREPLLIIEQLPLYPGALVSDGVDDYALVEGLPNLQSLIINANVDALPQREGRWAYLYDSIIQEGGNNRFYAAFNAGGVFSSSPNLSDGYAEKEGESSYEGQQEFCLFIHHNHDGDFGAMVFFSLLLFSRKLTPEEIEWVKNNLIENNYTVAELCAMGYGVATDYGYNLTGNFADAGVPIPTDLAARLAGEDGVLLKVTGLRADETFWEAVRQALAAVTVPSKALPGYFQDTNMSGDVTVTVDTGGKVFSAEDMLNGSNLSSLTISGTDGYFSSGHWAFRRSPVVSVTTDTPVGSADCSGMYEWCGKLESPAPVNWDARSLGSTYPEGSSNVEHMFDSCAALTVVPQYGDDREADANTLRPSRAYGFIGLSSVETLGPVLDLRYIDPTDTAVCTLMFPSGDSLTDARLQNLNHGDWWLDGTTGTGGVSHGNLAGLDAASVEYLMTNLWDLTTDKVGKNWRTTDNSWKMWTYEHTQELTDARAVVNFSIAPTGANANSWLRTQSALNGFKFRVTGLAEGDRLEFGAGVVAPSEASIYEDGEYVISKPNGLQGFKLYNDTETGTRVLTFEIVNEPYDAGNHLVDAAALHVPESWRAKLTTEMLSSAAARGWSVWIGEENLTTAS